MAKAELLKSIMIGLKHENNPREQPIFFFYFHLKSLVPTAAWKVLDMTGKYVLIHC